MLNEAVTGEVYLYHGHRVRVELTDGKNIVGRAKLNEQGALEVDGVLVEPEQAEDIVYLGKISEYNSLYGSGKIDEVYGFAQEKCVKPEQFDDEKYQEFESSVSCHLKLKGNIICAENVELNGKVHVLNEEVLSKSSFLYTFTDGSRRIGTLRTEGGSFALRDDRGNSLSFFRGDVVDITRAPVVNDYVYVRLRRQKENGVDGAAALKKMNGAAVSEEINGADGTAASEKMNGADGAAAPEKINGADGTEAPEKMNGADGAVALEEINGTVSMADGREILVIAEGKPRLIPLEQIEELRFRGQVTALQTIDLGYRYEHSYFRKAERAYLPEGAQVIFTAGVGRTGLVAKNIEETEGETLAGFAVALNGGHIRLATYEQYKSGGHADYRLINADAVMEQLKNIDRYDYPVNYRVYNLDSVEVTFVGESREKVFFGYIDTYYNESDRKYGYITPEEIYGKKSFVERLKENIDVFCRAITFQNAQGELDTNRYRYYVRYTLDMNAHDVKEPAREVFFLQKQEKNLKAPVLAPQAERSFRSDKVSLPGMRGEEWNGPGCAYGILAAYSVNFESFKIGELYQNKKYYDEDNFSFSEGGRIDVEAQKATLVTEGKLTTAKYAYIVCFVPAEDEFGAMAVDLRFPIKVIGRFNKKQVRMLKVEGETLLVESMETGTVEVDVRGDSVPELEQGETFFWETESGSFRTGEFQCEENGIISLGNGQKMPALQTEIWRLGILTDFDDQLQTGWLNGTVCFNFSVMESKTYNTIKTARRTMLLVYTTQNDKVSYVERPSAELLEQLSWTRGTVTETKGDEKSRSIVVDGEVTHYTSVLTDGLVNAMLKNESLQGQSVFYRRVNCPVWKEGGEVRLVALAADVHCDREKATIRYDAVQNRFLAYRNQTHSETLKGKTSMLRKLIDKETFIKFVVSESGLRLEAWLEQDSDGKDEQEAEEFTYEEKETEETANAEQRKEDVRRAQKSIREPDGSLGEYTYYMTRILRRSPGKKQKCENLYRLFLQDFYPRVVVIEKLDSGQKPGEEELRELFRQDCRDENVSQLVAHIMPLDEQSAEYLFKLDVIGQNENLSRRILAWVSRLDSASQFKDAVECLQALRRIYRGDERRYLGTEYFGSETEDICAHCAETVKLIRQRFADLMCEDDRESFLELGDCCERIAADRTAGFLDREMSLKEGYRKVGELEEKIKNHPTILAKEMLLENNLLSKIRGEIAGELDQLYKNETNFPDIRCYPNDPEVPREQNTKLIFLVKNEPTGAINGQTAAINGQTAGDVVFYFETLTEGVSVGEPKSNPRELKPGPGSLLEVPVDLSDLEEDSFIIAWSVEYTHPVGFNNGSIQQRTEKKEGTEHLQLLREEGRIDKKGAKNPYKAPAIGNPLKTGEMFYGRKTEFEEIWDYIVTPQEELIPGRTLIIYGQKRCGKTSLIYQIKNRLRAVDRVREQAIVIDIDNIRGICGDLSSFTRNLYYHISALLEEEIQMNHPDVEEMMEENDLVIPDLAEEASKDIAPSLFQQFFRKFTKLDGGRHKIVLIMDEFTRFCTDITNQLEKHPEYQILPDFIKLFSEMGFIQIIVGHAAMMRALSQLGVINHTAEFAKKMEISALKDEDARKLVKEPMEKCFGRDVYQTPLGLRAVDRLLELSGCSPSILMKLCDRMFDLFVDQEEKSQLIDADVNKMLEAYLQDQDGLNADTFDMLLTEDGEETAPDEEKPSYIYLKHIVSQSLHENNHDCDFNTVCPELEQMARGKSIETREILLDRRVLSMGNGRIRLNMWLFAEYIRYKYGM